MASSSARLAILLVEDDRFDAQPLEELLRDGGLEFDVTDATTRDDVEAALAVARPDVVITDYTLPGYGGLDVISDVHARFPDVPVIVISSKIGEKRAVETMRCGAVDCVMKDRLARLPASVRTAVAHAESLERLKRSATEEVRTRIGQELHDGVAQQLSGLAMLCVDLAGRLRSAGDAEQSELADTISNELRFAGEQVRAVIRGDLRPGLTGPGFRKALGELARRTQGIWDVDCAVEVPAVGSWPHEVELDEVFLIVAEAVTNAARHGQASSIRVTVETFGATLVLRVEDDGVGFDVSREGDGIGLNILRRRASRLGASLQIVSRPGAGTRIECRLLGHHNAGTSAGSEPPGAEGDDRYDASDPQAASSAWHPRSGQRIGRGTPLAENPEEHSL